MKPSEPPPLEKIILYPANGETIEIPAKEVGEVAYAPEVNRFIVIQVCADGHMERWINVPGRVIHKVPSLIETVAPGARLI